MNDHSLFEKPEDDKTLQFSAPWGSWVWFISIVGTVILLLAGSSLVIGGWIEHRWDGFALGILTLGVLLFTLGVAPRGYALNHSSFMIHRIGPDITIPLSEINSVERIHGISIFITLRAFGSGGLFGFIGFFGNLSIGMYRGYYTDRFLCVLITHHINKKIVISPDNPEAFIAAMNKKIDSDEAS